MSGHRRGRRAAARRPAQHAATNATRPGKVARKPIRLDRGNELHSRVVEYVSGDDRAWFDTHPAEHFRYRPAVEHEWCDPCHAPDCVPMVDVPAWADLWVEVEHLAPGARIRRPYLVARVAP